jgi:hypothetical protein
MKVLIVDDEKEAAEAIAKAICVIPDVLITICTMGFKRNSMGGYMPEQDEVERLILEHDIVLLDGTLSLNSRHYSGKTLLAFCEKHGKATVGISAQHDLGELNVHCKHHLITDRHSDSVGVEHAAEAFRRAVRRQIDRLAGTTA